MDTMPMTSHNGWQIRLVVDGPHDHVELLVGDPGAIALTLTVMLKGQQALELSHALSRAAYTLAALGGGA